MVKGKKRIDVSRIWNIQRWRAKHLMSSDLPFDSIKMEDVRDTFNVLVLELRLDEVQRLRSSKMSLLRTTVTLKNENYKLCKTQQLVENQIAFLENRIKDNDRRCRLIDTELGQVEE